MQQRSPVLFWLLLAATISVDAVVLNLALGEPYVPPGYLAVAVHALILGQLSVVCIWSVFNRKPNIWTQTAPLFGVVLAALVDGLHMRLPEHFRDMTTFTTCLGIFGLYAVLLMATLWLLQRTNFWRRIMGSARTWQFSLLHVLTAMTITAVLTALTRDNQFFGEGRWTNIIFACSYVALAVACVIIWSLSWNWFLRLASVLSVSLLFGIGAYAVVARQFGDFGVSVFSILYAYYLIQAIVLSVWLGVGPVLPPSKIDEDEMQNERPFVPS